MTRCNDTPHGWRKISQTTGGPYSLKDPVLISMHRREKKTPSTGIWNPKIHNIEDLIEIESDVIPFDIDNHDIAYLGESPSMCTEFSLLVDRINQVLSSLTEREEKVLRIRFGLGDGYPRTLEEVGSVLRVTRERVRNIEVRALRKMRHSSRASALIDFLDVKNKDQKEDLAVNATEQNDVPISFRNRCARGDYSLN